VRLNFRYFDRDTKRSSVRKEPNTPFMVSNPKSILKVKFKAFTSLIYKIQL